MLKKIFYLIIITMPLVSFSQVTSDFTMDIPSGNYCLGDTVFFINNSSGNYVISYWEFGDGMDTWSINPYHIFDTTGTFEVTLTVTDENGASNSTTKTINIFPTPVVSLVDDKFLHTITVQTLETGLTYQWLFNADTTAESDTIVYYLESGTYTVLATNQNGCTTSKSLLINLGEKNKEDSLLIVVKNNILTPGIQDGANDVLFIADLSDFVGNCQVVIYNKLGQMVYKNDNYTNVGGFEGKDNGGNELDAGTYYYIIKNEHKKTATGYIDLIR